MVTSNFPTRNLETSARRGQWLCVAVATFIIAGGVSYRGFFAAATAADVPIPVRLVENLRGEPRPLGGLRSADYRIAVWSVARNAFALLHRPMRLFDAESCFPLPNSLALHHPILAPAVIGLPIFLATGNPIATFNAALFIGVLLSAVAMYLLVADWTRVPAAGIAAGLLFAFHPSRLVAPYHFFLVDNAWLLLALLFARRLAERGRWRDGIGLGMVGSMQLASSSYPLYAAALTAVPFSLWLGWRYARQIRWRVLWVAVAPVLVTSIVVLGPYLQMEGLDLHRRPNQYFASWSWLLPTGRLFPGFAATAMIASAALLGKRRVLGPRLGDPRLVMALAALLLMLVAADGNRGNPFAELQGAPAPGIRLPHFYALLSSVVPGLDVIRLPSAIAHGVLLLACVLAGLGAAGLLRSVPARMRGLAGFGLIAIAFVETLFLGSGELRPVRFQPLAMRPPHEHIALFEELEALGNKGPLLEVPIRWSAPPFRTGAVPAQVLLSAYHHRSTSGCYASFVPVVVRKHERLSTGLLEPDGIARARAAGFTTLIVHHSDRAGRTYLDELKRVADSSTGALEMLATSKDMSAYSIGEPGG